MILEQVNTHKHSRNKTAIAIDHIIPSSLAVNDDTPWQSFQAFFLPSSVCWWLDARQATCLSLIWQSLMWYTFSRGLGVSSSLPSFFNFFKNYFSCWGYYRYPSFTPPLPLHLAPAPSQTCAALLTVSKGYVYMHVSSLISLFPPPLSFPLKSVSPMFPCF